MRSTGLTSRFRTTNEQKEETLLKKLKHRNIVTYLGSVYEERKHIFNLIQEFCESGSLAVIVKQSGPIPENLSCTLSALTAAVFVHDVLHALNFMHGQGVVHGDIKGANILLTTDGVIKLADFGTSTIFVVGGPSLQADNFATWKEGPGRNAKDPEGLGSPYWMAPELIGPPPTNAQKPCGQCLPPMSGVSAAR